jgi:hypothetical protein
MAEAVAKPHDPSDGSNAAVAPATRRPATPAELAAAKAAMRAAIDAYENLPTKMEQKATAVSSHDPSLRTLSGYDSVVSTKSSDEARSLGFIRDSGVNDRASMLDHGKAIGHVSPSRFTDNGIPGVSNATHAEKQLARVQDSRGIDAPMGVSREQCGDCRSWYRSESQYTNRRLVLADPVHTRVFHPDGSVDLHHTNNGTMIQSVPAGIAPIATDRIYEGVPW